MSDFLFAMPTFISGMGAAIDLGGTMMSFNTSFSPEEADALAFANDWSIVNCEIKNVIKKEIKHLGL